MTTQQAYDRWAEQYDSNANKTRDLEGSALRKTLNEMAFDNGLEIGCGTGKNTIWLTDKVSHLTAVDLSEEMLAKAKTKINSTRVVFQQADINDNWAFADRPYDLITFSLVLEHIADLDPIFLKVSQSLRSGGLVYIGELHPFKQYTGTKARFDTSEGRHIVNCFNHHLSDFIQPAKSHGLSVVDINEHFDDNDRSQIPRILTILLRKN